MLTFNYARSVTPPRCRLPRAAQAFMLAVLLTLMAGRLSAAHAQNINFAARERTTEQMLVQLRKQTGYDFLYNAELLDSRRKLTLNLKNTTMETILQELLVPQNLSWRINGKTVVITRAVPRAPIQFKVTGTVFDEQNNPMPGVTVREKGTDNSVQTDPSGRYGLTLTDDQATLVYSYVGYQQMEKPVAGKTQVNAALVADVTGLNDVVVVGYGTQRKRDLTGAISKVTADEIRNMSVSNPLKALQGKVPGLMITNTSGVPGSTPNVRIRGVGTTNNTNPLYVVDGMPIGGIEWLNPNDIESFEVLKDASATAIYGARAGNGVILVTTKKGSRGDKLRIQVDAQTGVSSFWNKVEMMDAGEYIDMQHRLLIENPNYQIHSTLRDKEKLLSLTERVSGSRAGTDWWDVMTRVAPMQNYNLTFSGGSNTMTYLLSAGYFNEQGMVRFSEYDKFTTRLNTTIDVTKRIKLSANVNATKDNRRSFSSDMDRGILLLARVLDPIAPLYRHNYNAADATERSLYLTGYNPNDPFSVYGSSLYIGLNNPYAKAERETLGKGEAFAVRGNAAVDVEILKSLKFRTDYGFTIDRSNSYGFAPKYYLKADDQATINKVTAANSITNNWVWQNTLTFDKQFGEHRLNALAGMTAEEYNFRTFNGSKDGVFYNDEYMRTLDAATVNPLVSGNWGNSALMSFLGRVNYAFKDRYLLTANIRRDGSSNFNEGNRWGTFPSASVGWIFTEESFLKGNSWLDEGKLRGGWGQIGNHNVAASAFVTLLGFGDTRRYVFGLPKTIVSGVAQNNFANPVKWETTEQYDLGLDLTMLKKRLSITADFYIKNTKDMLVTIPTPATVNYNSPWSNIGRVSNRGFELELDYRDKIGEFSYSIGANGATFRNRVESLGSSAPINGGSARIGAVTRTEEGMPIGYFYGYRTAGIFQNAAEVAASAQKTTAQPGDLRFVDIDGNGLIDNNDRTMIGNPFPDLTYGFNLGGAYKGFDISAFFQGSIGNEVFNLMKYWTNQNTGAFNGLKGMTESAWRAPGTLGASDPGNPSNTDFKFSTSTRQNLLVSDYFVEDGSYLRLRNLQIGYTLPARTLSKIGASSFRLFLSSQNLLTFTKYSGLDPELGDNNPKEVGIDRAVYPQARTFTFGLNASF
ncbi:TonB-dependent receptor [Pedobacter sp. SYP-B3415]|uniref:TonB-dependent receptor n=1 Tax=Pedobacter sp. SYP-B3415 TaxID=2496641 RepID=UPI00101D229A|nr:TonB-dependent receptor [Pedobacter sp. SYP-B3415]